MSETNPQAMGWNAASKTGVVAGGGAAAVAAGVCLLDRGGNAADAAVATVLALCVTDHGDCSIGGEVPLMIYDAASGEVKALSGQGRAPRSQAAIDWYMANGIPGEGDMKMAPVPSVIDLCVTTLQRYGTATFADAVAPTLALLDAGTQSWEPRLAVTLRKLVESERQAGGSREEKLQAATDRFYGRGGGSDIADALEAFYIAKGGFLRKADLAAHVTTVEEPVTARYRGLTVCKCGTWTQGPFLCQVLRLLDGFDVRAMGRLSADYVHAAIEAIKLSMADRDAYYADPDFVNMPLDALLSDAYTEMRRPLIDMACASLDARPGDPYRMLPLLPGGGSFRPATPGTSTCVVADRWGNVVAATPSANVWLDTVDGGTTGVTYGNRLRSLNTAPGHPNCIQPGKRPRITLTPTLVLKDGKPILAVSVAGGDLQDQVTLNLLLDFIDFGMAPADAVIAPRFATDHHENSFDPNPHRDEAFLHAGSLIVNDTVPQAVRDDLARRGHDVEVREGTIGNPVMLHVDRENGTFYAAGDPAANRHAAAMSED